MLDVKLYKKVEVIISFMNHVEQFTSLELKNYKDPRKAIRNGYHKTSLKTAKRFFRGMEIKNFEPLFKVENDSVIMNIKYNLYRGIHTEHALAKVKRDGIFRIDDSNKQSKKGVVRLTPNIMEATKYAEIKKEKENSIYGIVVEIDPVTIINELNIGRFGFERYNLDRDLKASEYKIYEIEIHENNPILYLYQMLIEILKNQGINLKEILDKNLWRA
ncbi:MAG: hypothetical protein EAX96_05030 [Candidatus Lokiarchaeota archaeon]|nr:hypothetical protein [Candidatus Lokiarchaeota archaeon]